jgi:hypothetical protein
MRRILQVFSWAALGATIVPSVLYLRDGLPLDAVKAWMLAGTVVWFVTAPLWMDRENTGP